MECKTSHKKSEKCKTSHEKNEKKNEFENPWSDSLCFKWGILIMLEFKVRCELFKCQKKTT